MFIEPRYNFTIDALANIARLKLELHGGTYNFYT